MSAASQDWRSQPVVIVGAGPTGLTAAALLAARGVRCLVLERRAEGSELPRGVHVDDEVMRILQHVGISHDFAPLTRAALGLRLLDRRHRTMAEFARDRAIGEHGYPQANMFHQPDLERLLRSRVDGLPGVELRTGHEVAAFEHAPDGGVTVVATDVVSGSVENFAASVVLGCDGTASTVRDLLGIRLRDLHFEERWLVVDIRASRPVNSWNGVHQVCDPSRAATFMRVTGDRLRFEFRLAAGEDADELAEPASLGSLLAPWTATDRLDGLEVVRTAEYTFRARLAERWRDGRVFLLGDAAHQTPPFIGQAIGLGLRDAENVAWKVAAVLAGGAPESLLDTYEAERKPHARALIRKAITAGWAMTGGQDQAAWIRRGVLSGLCRVPQISRTVLDRPSPPLRSGALVARRASPRSLAGRLVPQPALASPAQRLDDAMGDGFVVIADEALPMALATIADRLQAKVFQLGDPATAGPWGPAVPLLRAWLQRGHASAVLIRPDRVVLATVDRGGRFRPGPAAVGIASLAGGVSES